MYYKLAHRLSSPIINVPRVFRGIQEYKHFMRSWRKYSRLHGAEELSILDAYPCIFDRVSTHPFDAHYFYQDIWAFKEILFSGTDAHVDIGSRSIFVGMLTAITHTTYIDIRPMNISLANYASQPGSILDLPFADRSINSLSCLHVAEHIGLGRYGDSLDPLGTIKACIELSRILAPGGKLYFSVPIGKAKVCFNAHRIHAPQQIVEYFRELTLVKFAVIDDTGQFIPEARPEDFTEAEYACGLFCYTRS